MTENEIRPFVELVAEMRKAQKEFFKNKSYTLMQNSKFLEKEVDAKILEFSKNLSKEEDQPNLFGEENDGL